jgi:hypothetical protein
LGFESSEDFMSNKFHVETVVQKLTSFILEMCWKKSFYAFAILVSLLVTGCGKIWESVNNNSNNNPGGSSGQTYEYIYFGDQNNANLPGFSINTSSGVLTPIPNTPAMYGSNLSVGKIASDAQVLMASGQGLGSGYWISPTTGILNPITGDGFFAGYFTKAVFSPSALYVYSNVDAGSNGWIAQVSPTTGNFSNAVETGNFSAPLTDVTFTVISPNGNYVYFTDVYNNAIEGYSTSGGALNVVTGADTGSAPYGTHPGDKTYGLTYLPTPNAGVYHDTYPFVDSGANVIYFTYAGATGTDNNWLMPYKINADGSLTAGTPLNIGTNPGSGVWTAAGDSTGKYLFISLPLGGIDTYSIAADGSLTYVTGPIYSGQTFLGITINRENSLMIVGQGGTTETASINMTSGVLTPVSSMASPCGGGGILDPSENFIYGVGGGGPNTVCGATVSPSGVLGAILGQTYPLTITGSSSIVTDITIQMTSP